MYIISNVCTAMWCILLTAPMVIRGPCVHSPDSIHMYIISTVCTSMWCIAEFSRGRCVHSPDSGVLRDGGKVTVLCCVLWLSVQVPENAYEVNFVLTDG
jgi:hypothetical protein